MPDRFFMNHEELEKIAAYVQKVGNNLGTTHADLVNGLDQLGKPYGDDDIGKNFAKGYEANSHTALEGGKQVTASVVDWAKGLLSAGNNFAATDEANAQSVDHSMAEGIKNPPPDKK